MNWWYVPLFFLAVAITGYLWGMFKTLAHNDHCRHFKETKQ